MPIGFRIASRTRRIAPALVAAFRALPVANVSDCMARMSAGGARLRPMHRGGVLAGPAFTVRTRPGDNLMIPNALIGEIMTSHAQSRGIAGMVIDGAIRDSAELRQSDFPVYAAGVTHRGP